MNKNELLRIAFIDYVLEPDKPGRSGLSDIVWDMAGELINQGHEAHVIASYYTDQYPDSRVIVHNFPTPPIGYRNIIGQFWILKRAADIVKHNEFDIVHSPEYISTAVLTTLGVKTPLILTVPGNIYQRIKMGHGYEWWYVYVLKWAARVSAKKCAAVIAISKEMKKWWEWTGSNPDKTPLIPLGVNVNRFHPIKDARQLLELDKDKMIFLYVGRFSIEKGLLDLVEAVNKLTVNVLDADIEFILIGRGPLKQDIENLILKYGLEKRITLHEWVDQNLLPAWFSAADILLMPSRNEPLGRVMLESMMCGTPVIATTTEGPLDHIKHEINGFLYPPQDILAHAETLYSIIQERNKLGEVGKNAYLYSCSNLTWQIIMEQVIDDVYYPVLNLNRTN